MLMPEAAHIFAMFTRLVCHSRLRHRHAACTSSSVGGSGGTATFTGFFLGIILLAPFPRLDGRAHRGTASVVAGAPRHHTPAVGQSQTIAVWFIRRDSECCITKHVRQFTIGWFHGFSLSLPVPPQRKQSLVYM